MLKVIMLSLILLTGCVTKSVVTETPKMITHPEWPTPVQPYRFDWKVVNSESDVIVGLEYNQSLDFRLFLGDMVRYIKEQNEIICHYRVEVKDPRCLKLTP